jgi:hypothetical protein
MTRKVSYVPKSQRSAVRLKAYEYCGYLRSWDKRGLEQVEDSILKLNTRTSRIRRDVRSNNWRSRSSPGPPRHGRRTNLYRTICIVMMSTSAATSIKPKVRFDTDSLPVRVDNCSTACITNRIQDCLTVPKRIRCKVNGMGGDLSEVYSATIGWNFMDDNGVPHSFVLPKSLFVPGATSRLLSPQHWAQVAKDNYPLPHGTWCGTFDDTIVPQWKQRRFTKTILPDIGETERCIPRRVMPATKPSAQKWASTTTTLTRSLSRSTAISSATTSQTACKRLSNGTMPNPFSKGTRHYRRTSTLTARRIQRHQM